MNQAMASVLQAAGFEVATFFSAEALLATRLPDETAVLVLDVRLPGLTGFDLYERVVANHTRFPVIFVTAHDHPAARARSQSVGAAAFLAKPFAGKRLVASVDRLIRTNSPGT